MIGSRTSIKSTRDMLKPGPPNCKFFEWQFQVPIYMSPVRCAHMPRKTPKGIGMRRSMSVLRSARVLATVLVYK